MSRERFNTLASKKCAREFLDDLTKILEWSKEHHPTDTTLHSFLKNLTLFIGEVIPRLPQKYAYENCRPRTRNKVGGG